MDDTGSDQFPTDVAAASEVSKRSALPMVLSITALITAGIALVFGLASFKSSDQPIDSSISDVHLYQEPGNLKSLIQTVRASTVVIGCKKSQGSGWVIDLASPDPTADAEDLRLDREYPTEVVTNDHVIEDCHSDVFSVTATTGETTYDAVLYDWDTKHDLALLGIKQSVPALPLSPEPQPGWWVMGVGAPYGLEGAVSIGNVITMDGSDVISSAPLNSGNSGGPLINAAGEVVATNSWVAYGKDHPQDWNGSVSVPVLCQEIVNCGAEGLGWALAGETN